MSECKWAFLPDRGLLRVAGSEAQSFLQGLITNDVSHAGADGAIYTGLLTPQGKILFDFFVIADVDGFLLDAPMDRLDDLMNRLTFYKLRANVSILPMDDSAKVAAQWGSACPPLSCGFSYTDPRLGALGSRIVIDQSYDTPPLHGCELVGQEAYHEFRICLGVPEGGLDFQYEDVFPHDANFDFLGGVDFKKGCYVGQEVVSRMEHRGTARKRIVVMQSEGGPLTSGANIHCDDDSLGTAGSVSGTMGLAMVRLDRVQQALASGATIYCGSEPVKLTSPAYANFEIAA